MSEDEADRARSSANEAKKELNRAKSDAEEAKRRWEKSADENKARLSFVCR